MKKFIKNEFQNWKLIEILWIILASGIILSISILFLSLSNVYGTNYMIISGHEKKLRNITAVSSVIGFLISFPLIYYWDFVGAAITITLTRGILGIGIMWCALKLKRVEIW